MASDNLKRLKIPAVGLIAVGVLNGVWAILNLITYIWFGIAPQVARFPAEYKDSAYILILIGIGFLVINLITAPFIIYGAVQMIKGRKYGLSKIAAILALIPLLSFGFLIGIPFGIWALILLGKPEIKDAFSQAAEPEKVGTSES